jgi:integrase
LLATLLGLLFATGLRISEALSLSLGDVDLERRLLVVQRTKFKKSRYVPLSESTTMALARFMRWRAALKYPEDLSAFVFMSPKGGHYGKSAITRLFLKLARSLGIRGPKGDRGPRIHDFRHSFAVHRLAAWYREDADMQAKLPILSTYLGHTTLIGTQVYLQATAELLEQVSRRFRKSAPAAVLAA